MPLTAAEKQRRYRERIKADPERRQAFLQKERQRWHANKGKSNSTKPITELGPREQRSNRRYWRRKQQKHRKNIASEAEVLSRTPPESPSEGNPNIMNDSRRQNNQHRNRAKCYRDMDKLKKTLTKEKRKTEKYKKRYHRLLHRTTLDSPRSKTRKLLRHMKTNKTVSRTLQFHYALVADLKAKYHGTKQERKQQILARMMTGKIVKRYRLQRLARETFGFSQKRWKQHKRDLIHDQNPIEFKRQRKNVTMVCKLQKDVRSFYVRDDVSRSTAGKKETVTRHKKKMQKRILCESMKLLHLKFLSEHPAVNISYSLFCRLRPFWVVIPSIKDRDTCLCRIHENIEFIVHRLRGLKLLPSCDASQMAEGLACDNTLMSCMYGHCEKCKGNTYPIPANYDESMENIKKKT